MKKHSILLLGLLGMVIGIGFADIDLTLPFLRHRSMVTHSFFFPLVAWFLAVKYHNVRLRLFSIGFSTAMTVHLCSDLYPQSWWGFAKIHVPFFGRLPGTLSWAWIAINIVITLYLALWLVWSMRDMILAAVSAIAPFILFEAYGNSIPSLITFAAAVGLTFWLSEQEFRLKTAVESWLHIDNAEEAETESGTEEKEI